MNQQQNNQFDANAPLDLSGSGGKRESLSPDNKRSSMAEAAGGSPLKAALLTGPGAPAQMKKGLQPGLGAGNGPAPGIAADLLPVKQSSSGSSGGSGKNNAASKDTKPADQIGSQESDSFYKMYNKEIKVNQDEIPIILSELTDAAFNFIQRENYEKALILLQKTEGVLEVVSLEGCSRDRLGMLEECIFYLKQSIALVSDTKFYKSKKISHRNRRVNQECKLKLQLCAILSQNQNHSEALENARKSVRLAHQMFKDMEELCQIYIDKINYHDNLVAAQEQSDLEDAERLQYISMVLESSPAKEIPKNFLEKSISLVERSSLKMFPVVREVRRRLVNSEISPLMDQETEEKKQKQLRKKTNRSNENSSEKGPIEDGEEEGDEEKPDMRSVLGFLNQNEWIFNLNIGNIMQIQPLNMKEFLQDTNDEMELSRDSFLSKLSILIVTYFCMSTEMRFLIQSRAQYLKPEVKKERELESEFWHAKALEIACTFLPSECPLLNHVLLSYQKHHDPSMQPIKEDEESNDVLSVLRPLKGIEQSKYQPIVRTLPQVKVALSPQPDHVPLKEVLRQFDADLVDQVVTFNASKVRKVGDITDKEVQVAAIVGESNSPTQANLSAIVLTDKVNNGLMNDINMSGPIGVIDNSNILPMSLNDSRADAMESEHSQQTSTQKLKQEMYLQEQSLLNGRNFPNNHGSIEGLEEQLMEAMESPPRKDQNMQEDHKRIDSEFKLDSNDNSFAAMDLPQADDESEAKMYDMIISKVLANPRIDKRTLLQKFISKIEMESNMNTGLSTELSHIKKLMSKDSSDQPLTSDQAPPMNAQLKQHAVSQVEQSRLLEDAGLCRHTGAHSMEQIQVMQRPDFQEEGDSEIMLNVPSETMGDQVGVQDTRASRDHKRLQRAQKPGSAKPGSQNRDVQKSRIDTSTRTRSSSHGMKQSKQISGGHHRKHHAQGSRLGADHKDFRKVKSYLEEESLFKDIERSTEIHDPLNLNVMENSDAAPIDIEDIQLEQKSSQKEESHSRSNSHKRREKHHSSVQSTDHHLRRNEAKTGQASSHQKSVTHSRPHTAFTNTTRPSSVNQKRVRRRRNPQGNQASVNPQKTLVAQELHEGPAGERPSRSESSSRGRYQKYQARYQQNNRTTNLNLGQQNNNIKQGQTSQQRLRHSQARKRLSINHQHMSSMHGQSVEQQPSDKRVFNKVSQKRLQAGSKHHNLSVQQTQLTAQIPAPASSGHQHQHQHHNTTKIKKLVSHKQIETGLKKPAARHSKQKLSQTKNMQTNQHKMSTVNQQPLPARGRSSKQQRKHHSKSKSKSKSKSRSRSHSSGQRTFSGSSRHQIRSRSNNRSGSDNRKNLYNELAQYSLDLIDGDQVNINAASAQQLIAQHHSKNQLQKQVLENQKTILGLLTQAQQQQARTNSNESRKSRSQNRKKGSFSGLGNIQDLMPKKQSTMSKIQRLSMNHSQAQSMLQAQELPQQSKLGRFSSNQTQLVTGVNHDIENDHNALNRIRHMQSHGGMQNSASQHVKGLSNFISQINQSKRQDQTNQINKSLQYLKKQQSKAVSGKGASQPARTKQSKKNSTNTAAANQVVQMAADQNRFKQNLMKEMRSLRNRLSDRLEQEQKENSPARQRSGSQKRSGDERSYTRSRSRSPSQPTKALIPKKKSFDHMLHHSKNMNQTTNEVSQFQESLLNMSSGEPVKPNRAHATSKLAKRKLENLIQHQQHLGNLAYNSLEEAPNGDVNKIDHKQLATAGQANAHHSLSMFDSEVSLNKVNQFVPLHHQLSQNVIPASQNFSQSSILGQKRPSQHNVNVTSQVSGGGKTSKQVKLPKRSSQNPDKRHQQPNAQGNYRTNPHVQPQKAKMTKN